MLRLEPAFFVPDLMRSLGDLVGVVMWVERNSQILRASFQPETTIDPLGFLARIDLVIIPPLKL